MLDIHRISMKKRTQKLSDFYDLDHIYKVTKSLGIFMTLTLFIRSQKGLEHFTLSCSDNTYNSEGGL